MYYIRIIVSELINSNNASMNLHKRLVFHNLIILTLSKYYRFRDKIFPWQSQMHRQPLYNSPQIFQVIDYHGVEGIFLHIIWVDMLVKDYINASNQFQCNTCMYNAYIDGLVQDCSNSIANALELLQACTKPSICCYKYIDWSIIEVMCQITRLNSNLVFVNCVLHCTTRWVWAGINS